MTPSVIHVVHSLGPGGTENLVIQLALAAHDHARVAVCTLDPPGAWAERLRSQGIAVHCLWRGSGVDWRLPARIAQVARLHKASVIHAHQCSSWFYSALARVLAPRLRVVLHEHGRFWPEVLNPLRRMVQRLLLVPLTHRFLAVSPDIADRLSQFEGIPRSRIEIVLNGVADRARSTPDEILARRASVGLLPAHRVIGMVGRLDPIKNHDLMLRAVAPLLRADSAVRLLIVGEGPERQRITEQIAALGLGDQVVLLGHRDDARAWYDCMDFFVLCSLSEGTSIALIEALSSGLTAVVTRVGHNAELVIDGVTGWVVPSADPSALQVALGEALSDPQRLRAWGLKARHAYEQNWQFEVMSTRIQNLHDALVSEQTGRAPGIEGRAA